MSETQEQVDTQQKQDVAINLLELMVEEAEWDGAFESNESLKLIDDVREFLGRHRIYTDENGVDLLIAEGSIKL